MIQLFKVPGKDAKCRVSDSRHGCPYFIPQGMEKPSQQMLFFDFLFLSWRPGQAGAGSWRAWGLRFQLGKVVMNLAIPEKPRWKPEPPGPAAPHTCRAPGHRSTCLQITLVFCLVQQQLFTLPSDVIRASEFTGAYYELSCVLSWRFVSVAVIIYIY